MTHNCLLCNINYPIAINHNNSFNCYQTCIYHYYFDKDNYYHCTINSSCPKEYPKLIGDKNECIKFDIMDMIYNIPKYEKNETEGYNKERETKYYDEVIYNLELGLTSEYFDTSELDSGEEQIIETEKMKITLTTTQNQINKTKDNLTSIYLGHCETLLRFHYNISDDKLLYMKKLDITQEGMKIPKVEFDIYCKLTGSNLIKLNMSLCEKEKFFLSVPVSMTESNEKLNISSEYYNNKCHKTKSDSGTDILLKDRQKEFVEGNKTICQDDCTLSAYDYDIEKANCSCQVKESSSSFSDMTIDKNKLYEHFDYINKKKEISNIGLTSCNVFSSKDNIITNTGFFLLTIILVIFIIVFIIFCTRGYVSLENEIDGIINKKFQKDTKGHDENINRKIKRKSKTSKNIIPTRADQNLHRKDNRIRKKTIIQPSSYSKQSFIEKKQSTNNRTKRKTSINQKDKNDKLETSLNQPDTNYEMNWLSYKEAMKYDKRTNCEIYGALIMSKQLILFTFCTFNDYNSGIIKKFMFFLSFALHYTVNALFFNESNMHQIYEDKGKYNFEYQLPYIISSAIISTVALRLILQFLVLTDKDILQVKLQSTKAMAINIKKERLKCMKIRFAIFFILNFTLLILFWYYLTSFNAIYANTQVYLIENTFISFGFSLFYPLIFNLFPMILRISALHSPNKDKEYLYKISQFIQII